MGRALIIATAETPGMAPIFRAISSSIRMARSGSFDLRIGNPDAHRLQLFRSGKAGIHVPQRTERTDHQAGTDQQDQRQPHLHDHEKITRAMPLLALAEGAPAANAARSKVEAAVLEDRVSDRRSNRPTAKSLE